MDESQTKNSKFQILNGTYFEIVKTVDNIIEAKCLNCPNNNIIRGVKSSNSNFVVHLKRKHKTIHQNYLNSKNQEQGNQNQKSHSLKKYFKPKTGLKEKINNAITSYIIMSMVPLDNIKYLKHLFKDLFPEIQILNKKALFKSIHNRFVTSKQAIISKLQKIDFVGLTVDVWSKGSKSFFITTIHWIDENFERKGYLLSFKKLITYSHTFETIVNMLQETIQTFQIEKKKIVSITTNNGSNFIKAFKEFGVNFISNQISEDDFDVEMENQVVTFDDADDFDEDEYEADHCDVHDNDETDAETDDNDDFFINEEIFWIDSSIFHLPSPIKCLAHSFSLIASSDLKKSFDTDEGMVCFQTLKLCLRKCSSIWKSCKNPKKASIIYSIVGQKLMVPTITRWNSLFDSIKCLLDVKHHLNFITSKLHLPPIYDSEIEILENYLTIMSPIAWGLNKLQAKKNMFLGSVLPIIYTIKHKIEGLERQNLKNVGPLFQNLSFGFKKRFKSFITLDDNVNNFIISSISHPSFKLKWVPKDKLKKCKNLFIGYIQNLETEFDQIIDQSHDDFYFESMDEPKAKNLAELEALQYFECLSEDFNCLQNFPKILKIFREFNTPLPSSAAVEQIFNISTFLITPKKNRLYDETIEYLLFCRTNSEFD